MIKMSYETTRDCMEVDIRELTKFASLFLRRIQLTEQTVRATCA